MHPAGPFEAFGSEVLSQEMGFRAYIFVAGILIFGSKHIVLLFAQDHLCGWLKLIGAVSDEKPSNVRGGS